MPTTTSTQVPTPSRRGRWVRSRIGVAVAAATIGGLSAGIATAAAVDTAPAPVVNACVNRLTGLVRVVPGAGSCLGLVERPLAWDQFGSPGATGPAGADGVDGERGPQGLPGANGADGEVGPAGGVSGYQVVEGTAQNAEPFALVHPEARCPGGKVVVGGGYYTNSPAANPFWSMPLDNGGNGWQVKLSASSQPFTATAFAICVDGS